jgi:hypothetical protein
LFFCDDRVSVPSGLCRDRTEPAVPSPAKRSEPSASNATQPKKSDNTTGNPRNSSQVWIESISKEEATRKQWQEMYGWMADYDPRVCVANDEHTQSPPIFSGKSENTKSCRRQFDAFFEHGQCLSLSFEDRFCQAFGGSLFLVAEFSRSRLRLAFAKRSRPTDTGNANVFR